MKAIIVLTAIVQYPSSKTSCYLSSNSYVIEKGNIQDIDKAIDDFKSHVEVDDFKMMNMIAYIVPTEQVSAVQ